MTLAFLFDSVGFGEWIVLFAVILIVVGPKRLPATARKFGQYYAKFRRAAESFKRQLMDMDSDIGRAVKDIDNTVSEVQRNIAEADAQWREGLVGTTPSPAPVQTADTPAPVTEPPPPPAQTAAPEVPPQDGSNTYGTDATSQS